MPVRIQRKRAKGWKAYDNVIFWDGYKKRSPETVIVRPYRGYELQTITHPEFGPEPVCVFAIYAQGVWG